ncbi:MULTISPECIES: NUDIX hydrolase [Enterococcus]|uniref:Nudix hydrolase domain-containing protein n=1 Tax=Enterococcus alishanensis TaxID=1303817 RepID=A0ABS6TF54_9ENTE|nr:hypothetical protein [Enterococcus alishanensis]MBV7391544.1 hypothetical protein [Enterococcus alishanensis]
MKKAYGIIIRNGLILLVRTPGIPIWDLPGGVLPEKIGEREGLQQIIYENLDFEAKVKELIGIYTKEYSDDITYIYKVEEAKYQSKMDSDVYSAYSFFDIDSLPLNLYGDRRKQIKDFQTGRYPIRLRFKKNKWIHRVESFIKEKKPKQL